MTKQIATLRTLANALEPASVGVVVEDTDGVTTLLNQAFCEAFGLGLPVRKFEGQRNLLSHYGDTAFQQRVRRLIREQAPVMGEVVRSPAGQSFSRDYIPVLGRDGLHHLFIYRPLDDPGQADLRRPEDLGGKIILETALDAIITIDANSRIVGWNPAAERMFGYAAADALGLNMAELIIPAESRQAHTNGMARYLRTGKSSMLGTRIELHALHQRGHQFPVELSIVAREHGGQSFFTAFMRDNSARHKYEEAMKSAKEAAEQASNAKTDFLATMSHEIRTPLNAILGMAELLGDTSLTIDQQEYVQTMRGAGVALLALLNDFLDLSKIEAGQLDLVERTFSPLELAQQAIGVFRIAAQSKGLQINLFNSPEADAIWVKGDSDRLRQVLLNLVGNAVKFTERGEIEIELRLEARNESEMLVRFAVTDTGIGIPQDQQDQVFGHFRQGDISSSRRFGGTGLGLSICRALMERMGGKVWLESSSPGYGSEFVMEAVLKIAVDNPMSVQEARKNHPAVAVPLCVLVVDDSEANVLLTQTWLERQGYEVVVANDGRQAVQEVYQRAFDAVLMDLEMPYMDGIQAVQTIRTVEHQLGPYRVPIIALTAHVLNDTRQRCIDAGMDDYLAKPVEQAALLSCVERWADPRPVVLCVDDSYEMRLLLERYLQHDGRCRYMTAASAARALGVLERINVHLMLVDIEMPVMNGLALAKQIRKDSPFPIVALTGHRDAASHQRALEAGFDHVLTKPIGRADLVQCLDRYLPVLQPDDEDQPTEPDVAASIDISALLPAYIALRRQDLEQLTEGLERQDFELIRRLGHNMKGTAATYGFPKIGVLGAELEAAGHNQNPQRAQEAVDGLRVVLANID